MGLDAYVGTLLNPGDRDDFDSDEEYDQRVRGVQAYDSFVREVVRRLAKGQADWTQRPTDDPQLHERIGQYGVLQFLRRYACYVSVHGVAPSPVPEGLEPEDPTMAQITENLMDFYANWDPLRQIPPKGDPPCRFVHLVWHSDADGVYVPVHFRDPVFVPYEDSNISIGSSLALLAELDALNAHLKLDRDAGQMTVAERENFWDDHQADPYLREKWVWAVLHWLARMSVGTNQVVFFD